MIRILALLIGLAVGLAAAATVYGRVSHLRAAAPWLGTYLAPLPGWTDALSADAGVLSGAAFGPSGVVLSWQLDGIDLDGPRWSFRADGAGLSLVLQARLAAGPALALDNVAGEAAVTGARLSGHFVITGGEGRIDAAGLTLTLTAQGRRQRLDGVALPDGPVTLTLDPGAGWRLELGDRSLAGPDLSALLGV